jgi:flagellar basal body-associated protein FliL
MKYSQNSFTMDNNTKTQLQELADAKTLAMSAVIRTLVHKAYSELKSEHKSKESA